MQNALLSEIEQSKRGLGKKTEIINGQRISEKEALQHIYRFESDDAIDWFNRKKLTEITVNINGEDIFGRLHSVDKTGISILFEVDKGDHIEEATLQDSAFFLLEILNNKLEKVKKEQFTFNIDGSMKLFGFQKPLTFEPILRLEQEHSNFIPNTNQRIAIEKSLSQEITFIWGPPGTGKTKTLSSILSHLVKAGKKVLLTANTNPAVDEILKKIIEDKENASILGEKRIVRLGMPTFEDEHLKDILIEKIVEEKSTQKAKRIEQLQHLIETALEKIKFLEIQEKEAIEKDKQKIKVKQEIDAKDQQILSITQKIEVERKNLEQNSQWLVENNQLLEKAKNTNIIRRKLTGVDINQLEFQIKSIESQKYSMLQEFQTLQHYLKEAVNAKHAILNKFEEFSFINPYTGEIITPQSTRQKISEIYRQNLKYKEEIDAVNAEIEKLKPTIINNSQVVAATIARASIDPAIANTKFDTLILDEASMALLPNIFFLAGLCSNHYIISGDFRQLAPISLCRSYIAEKWLKRDIFVQAGIVEQVDSKSNNHDSRPSNANRTIQDASNYLQLS